jgi:O-antigen/teichoic acid export membrane protein
VTPVSYHSAIPISKWIIISYVVYGSYLLYANGLFVARKSRLVPLATVVAAVINVLLNFILIPQYGSYGAVLATAVSFTTMSAIIYRMAAKHYPLDVGIKFLFLVFLVPMAYFAMSFYLDGEVDTAARLIIKTVLTLIAGIFLYGRIKEPRSARQMG